MLPQNAAVGPTTRRNSNNSDDSLILLKMLVNICALVMMVPDPAELIIQFLLAAIVHKLTPSYKQDLSRLTSPAASQQQEMIFICSLVQAECLQSAAGNDHT